jgi:hypothetical protein
MIIAEELPDDFFKPTIADIKARQQQLHARAVTLNNAPLLTRAQREEQAKVKRDRWPNVRPSPLPPLRVFLRFLHNPPSPPLPSFRLGQIHTL